MSVNLTNSNDIICNSISFIEGDQLVDLNTKLTTLTEAIQGLDLTEEQLQTISEISTALNDNATAFTTLENQINLKRNIADSYTITQVDNLTTLTNFYNKTEINNLTDLGNYYNITQTNNLTTLTNFYNKSEITNISTLPNFYNKSEITNISTLPNFYNKSEITNISTLPNFYNKTEIEAITSLTNFYTFTQTNDLLDTKITNGQDLMNITTDGVHFINSSLLTTVSFLDNKNVNFFNNISVNSNIYVSGNNILNVIDTTYTKTETNNLLNTKQNTINNRTGDGTQLLFSNTQLSKIIGSNGIETSIIFNPGGDDDGQVSITLNQDNLTTLSNVYNKSEVDILFTNLIDGAPTALNTLNELAAALADDANYATNIENQLLLKADKATTYTQTTTNSLLDTKQPVFALGNPATSHTKLFDDNVLKAVIGNNIGIDDNTTYVTLDASHIYTKTETDNIISNYYTQTTTNSLLDTKQPVFALGNPTTSHTKLFDSNVLKSVMGNNIGIDDNTTYVTLDASHIYTKTETDNLLGNKQDTLDLTDLTVGDLTITGTTTFNGALNISGLDSETLGNSHSEGGIFIGRGSGNIYGIEVVCNTPTSYCYLDFTVPDVDRKARLIYRNNEDFKIEYNEDAKIKISDTATTFSDKVAIGTLTAGSQTLYVAGNARITGDAVINGTLTASGVSVIETLEGKQDTVDFDDLTVGDLTITGTSTFNDVVRITGQETESLPVSHPDGGVYIGRGNGNTYGIEIVANSEASFPFIDFTLPDEDTRAKMYYTGNAFYTKVSSVTKLKTTTDYHAIDAKLAIGTLTEQTQTLHVAGNARITGDTVINGTLTASGVSVIEALNNKEDLRDWITEDSYYRIDAGAAGLVLTSSGASSLQVLGNTSTGAEGNIVVYKDLETLGEIDVLYGANLVVSGMNVFNSISSKQNELYAVSPLQKTINIGEGGRLDLEINNTTMLSLLSSVINPIFCSGSVDSDGTKLYSRGRIDFTSSRTSTGLYEITFASSYGSANYVVTCSSYAFICNIESSSIAASSFSIFCRNASNDPLDRQVCFMVM
jgi:hypothetical protein